MGFWVASTMNGGSSAWVSPNTVTCRSSMASNTADCVLGVARLISSASTRLAKTGPRSNRKPRAPLLSVSTWVPIMSDGIRSGVNCTRLKERPRTRPMVLTSKVLPKPGTPSRSTCPPAKKAISAWATTSSWPTMTRSISPLSRE